MSTKSGVRGSEWQGASVGKGARSRGPSGLNWEVLVCVLLLLALGCVMVFSVTAGFADNPRYNVSQTYFIVKHLQSVFVGIVAGFVVMKIPMKFWFRWWFVIAVLAVGLLVVVLVPGIGKGVNGAQRWIPLGVVNLQASEVTKVAALICAAAFTVKNQDYMHSFLKGFIPMACFMVLISILIMRQPDLGATIVIVAEIMGILFLGGLNLWIFGGVICAVIMAIIWMIVDTPWRLGRFLAYLDPWNSEYVLDKAYQLSHSLIAFGRGEILGVGLGASVEKLYYLPEAHTDFIMAVIAEETGFVGVAFVFFLYYWLIRQAFEIGRQAIKLQRYFAGLLAQGIGVWFGVQVVINVGVASGAFPTKGLTLPFVSFGGSALLSSLIAVGMLLRADRENKILMRGGQV